MNQTVNNAINSQLTPNIQFPQYKTIGGYRRKDDWFRKNKIMDAPKELVKTGRNNLMAQRLYFDYEYINDGKLYHHNAFTQDMFTRYFIHPLKLVDNSEKCGCAGTCFCIVNPTGKNIM